MRIIVNDYFVTQRSSTGIIARNVIHIFQMVFIFTITKKNRLIRQFSLLESALPQDLILLNNDNGR